MTLPDCAAVGRIRRPHGVRGELLLEALTDEPGAIFVPGRRVFQGTADGQLWLDPRSKQPRELEVQSLRSTHGGWLLRIAEIADRTEAEKWNGRCLLVPVEELSEPDDGEVFLHELPGMQLVDADSGAPIGEVTDFYELPQGLLLEFSTEKGSASLPFVEEFVEDVDRDARVIRVRLPDGLLED